MAAGSGLGTRLKAERPCGWKWLCRHGSPLLRLSHSALVYLLYSWSKLAPTSISSGSKLWINLATHQQQALCIFSASPCTPVEVCERLVRSIQVVSTLYGTYLVHLYVSMCWVYTLCTYPCVGCILCVRIHVLGVYFVYVCTYVHSKLCVLEYACIITVQHRVYIYHIPVCSINIFEYVWSGKFLVMHIR